MKRDLEVIAKRENRDLSGQIRHIVQSYIATHEAARKKEKPQ